MFAPHISLSTVARDDFGVAPILAKHNLQDCDLFSDGSLVELLDRFPREHLYALTMGHDVTRPEQNRLALHDGVSGAELLRAVKNGRLWLNITGVDRADAQYRKLIDSLYATLAAEKPGFVPLASQGALLISSPRALVYYHADAPCSMLWHVRGRKRIWIYPALHPYYADREHLEGIFAGERHEYLPYRHEFDTGAVSYELHPGDCAAWPQNAPHRITNLDSLNVSLTTEHFTAESVQRQRVYVANRFFRKKLRLRRLADSDSPALDVVKTFVQRAANKVGLDPVRYRAHQPVARIDADAPNGVVDFADLDRRDILGAT